MAQNQGRVGAAQTFIRAKTRATLIWRGVKRTITLRKIRSARKRPRELIYYKMITL